MRYVQCTALPCKHGIPCQRACMYMPVSEELLMLQRLLQCWPWTSLTDRVLKKEESHSQALRVYDALCHVDGVHWVPLDRWHRCCRCCCCHSEKRRHKRHHHDRFELLWLDGGLVFGVGSVANDREGPCAVMREGRHGCCLVTLV
jgi:hypothetical protein